MLMRRPKLLLIAAIFTASPAWTQALPDTPDLTLTSKELPKARLWEPYFFPIQVSGGIEPYHWRVEGGKLPPGFFLNPGGELAGTIEEEGPYEFTLETRDNSNPPRELKHEFTLSAETPLSADWDGKAQVSGTRIDGSVKVSNRTGRDFDLTFVVLAVNNIGRANAIGYQHFSLKKNTEDMVLPFGDTLSPGSYVVNVDVIGEEPVSKQIFRARLVTGKESVATGL
jgi:hypothetical protein